jgi:gamma-glutamylcyclotransferase (GGCT)/AIG2-like uncharacterized protein YtfP
VFGTLKPGLLRWPIVAPFVEATDEAEVVGRIWDTGNDFPAARFGDGGPVRGVLLHLRPGCEEEALRILDEVEGDFLYTRTEIHTTDGRPAIAYEWTGETASFAELDGAWEGI